jgi:hypothetical protein
MTTGQAKKRLAKLWFILGGSLFILMLALTLNGKFEEFTDKAWGWFFPNVLPTLSLMISVFLFDQSSSEANTKELEIFYFQIAFYISLFYLCILFIIILTSPITGKPMLDQMEQSSLYLGPIQGLVAGAVGLFFIKEAN